MARHQDAAPVGDAAPRIVLVDDDAGIRRELSSYLEHHGLIVEAVDDIKALDMALSRQSFDLIILDVMLAGESGLDACKRLSQSSRTPIILISAMGAEVDRIIGLEIGADVYMAKPFNPRELLANIRAQLRRRAEGFSVGVTNIEYHFRNWRLNVTRHQLFTPTGVLVQLSSNEFRTLTAFVERPRQVLSRERLLDLARGDQLDVYDRAIDVMVSRLRRKLGRGSGGETLIETIRSEGYMFSAAVVRQ